MTYLKILIVTLFLINCFNTLSQNLYSLSGKVQNENGDLIQTGEISLIRIKDNKTIKTDALGQSGEFHFESIEEGDFIILISSNGYKDLFHNISIKENQSNLTLILCKNIVELGQVEILIKRNTFTNVQGNIKVDIDNSIYKSVPSSLDLITKLPNIQLSPTRENISVVGKGNALIYIDNQRVKLEDLNALSVEDIKSIEIINNPSAKYEAEGKAVILITRKISRRDGFEMTVSEVASLKKRFNNYAGVNSSFKKKKTEIKFNFNYNLLNPWEKNSNSFEIKNKNIASNYIANSFTKRPQFIYGTGIYHQFNENDYISFNINQKSQHDKDEISTNTFQSDNSHSDQILTLNNNDETRNFLNTFINYNKKINPINSTLFVGLQYTGFKQKSNSIVGNNYNNTHLELTQKRIQVFGINAYSGRFDFEKEFKNKLKWRFGALYLSAEANTNFDIQSYTPPSSMQSNYNYKEDNAAAYTEANGNIRKLTYNIGVRAENTAIKGRFGNDSSLFINKSYTNLFPKAQLDIPIDSTKTLSLNYAKSIARPNYSSTSQVSVYINPNFIFDQNIGLNPTFTDEIFANFQYKNKSIKFRYYYTKNPSYFSFYFDSTATLLHAITKNYEKESGFNIDFTLPIEYKIWSSTNSISAILNRIEDPSAQIHHAAPYLYFYTNHMFKLEQDFIFSLTVWGLTKRYEGAFERNALFITNLALSKSFSKNKNWEVTLSLNDIFRQMKFAEYLEINKITSNAMYYIDAQEVALSIRYKLGKISNSSYKEQEIDNNNRIR